MFSDFADYLLNALQPLSTSVGVLFGAYLEFRHTILVIAGVNIVLNLHRLTPCVDVAQDAAGFLDGDGFIAVSLSHDLLRALMLGVRAGQ